MRRVRILRRDGTIQHYTVRKETLWDYEYRPEIRAWVLIGKRRRYLVIFSTHETRDRKRTGTVFQFEVVVVSTREEAVEEGIRVISGSVAGTPLERVWEELTWLPGIAETDSEARYPVFRKLSGDPPSLSYSKRLSPLPGGE